MKVVSKLLLTVQIVSTPHLTAKLIQFNSPPLQEFSLKLLKTDKVIHGYNQNRGKETFKLRP